MLAIKKRDLLTSHHTACTCDIRDSTCETNEQTVNMSYETVSSVTSCLNYQFVFLFFCLLKAIWDVGSGSELLCLTHFKLF